MNDKKEGASRFSPRKSVFAGKELELWFTYVICEFSDVRVCNETGAFLMRTFTCYE